MTKRGILFDKIEGADDTVEEVARASSPFHDDHNDDPLDDHDLLFDVDPEGEREEAPAVAVSRDDGVMRRLGKNDPSVMMRRMALRSGHQSGYKESPRVDFVDELREKERKARAEQLAKENRKLEVMGYKWPDEWKDRPERTIALNRDEAARGIGKPVPFYLKVLAQRIGADPTALRWPRHMHDLNNKQITQVCEQVKTKKMTAAVFNYVVDQLEPMEQFRRRRPKITLEHVFRDGEPAVIPAVGGSSVRRVPESLPQWSRPFVRNPVTMPSGITDHTHCKDPMEFGVIMSEQWMEDVEAGKEILVRNRHTGKMEPLVTHCAVTEESLVRKKPGDYWLLAPNIWGMSIKAARVVVTAAAVEAGLLEGKVNYPGGDKGERIRQAVSGLTSNPDAWCVAAVACSSRTSVTRDFEEPQPGVKYPPLHEQAADVMVLRDSWYFGLTDEEVDQNRRELVKLRKRLTEFGIGR